MSEPAAAPIVYAGIDEAGYGPRLGPLCVAASVFRVEGWTPGGTAPDLWKRFSPVVSKEPGRGRAAARTMPVNDSKRLKLANSTVGRHPLIHLETGVLPFLAVMGVRPRHDEDLLAALGGALERHPWCHGDPAPSPVSTSGARMGVLANALAARMDASGASVLDLRCSVVGESAFNTGVRSQGTKAAVSFESVAALLRRIWDEWGHMRPRVVVDRQGGRLRYELLLRRTLPDAEVRTLVETNAASRYEALAPAGPAAPGDGGDRRMTVHFEVEAEQRHLPVALASMTAKLVRETAMARFNRYWCARVPGLAPTAGYALDARRWLKDVRRFISADERRALVRRV